MPEELLREIRKLEVRLNEFLENEKASVEALKNCLAKFLELNEAMEEMKAKPGPEQIEKVMKLRLEAAEALSDALEKESKTEHERSHLLESYGALMLALEKCYQNVHSMTSQSA